VKTFERTTLNNYFFSFQELQACFESQDIQKLQDCIRNMPEQDAKYHMKRCVDSGLWKPAADDPDTNPEDGFRRRPAPESDDDDSEQQPEKAVDNEYEELPAAKKD